MKAKLFDDARRYIGAVRGALIRPVLSSPKSAVAQLASRTFAKERQMYNPVGALLAAVFPDFQVSDTHADTYLDARAPDITISRAGVQNIHTIYVHTVIELERTDENIDSAMLGQGLDQLCRLARHQPWRTQSTMLATNLSRNHLLRIQCASTNPAQLVEFAPVEFETAIDTIGKVLQDPPEQPDMPCFSEELGVMKCVLGSNEKSVVGEFQLSRIPHEAQMPVPQQGTMTVAVKCSRRRHPTKDKIDARSLGGEIDILCQLQEAGGHDNIAKIVYSHPSKQEFGMLPSGEAELLGSNQDLVRKVCNEILSATSWVHKQHFVHRDIRWDNIVLHHGSAVLIDVGSAISVADPPSEVEYYGDVYAVPPGSSSAATSMHRTRQGSMMITMHISCSSILSSSRNPWRDFRLL